MIKYVDYFCFDDIIRLCEGSKETIRLCSPFVKTSIIERILNCSSVPISLITNINLQSFHRKASDIDALRLLLDNDTSVFNCSTLHAKVYIFDYKTCFVTSANLTPSGLTRNLERGIITDDPYLVNSALSDFSFIINNASVGKITKKTIETITQILKNIPKSERIDYPNFEITALYEDDLSAITKHLNGWKFDVFQEINNLPNESFNTIIVNEIAENLKNKYPNNNNREAKVRQQLQHLRDLGLVEFISPGIYKRLWRKKPNAI
ncbi:MAG: phospholipase D-like domain-containing protein [Desulfobulbaceae bacterium]|nr:phospholipase D-like domain-containing protein [Desulfobulbaceae bacterium]